MAILWPSSIFKFNYGTALGVRVPLQTGPESKIDALSSKRTWLQHMCCTLITPDVLICRKRKERLFRKEENDRKRGWNSPS
jgi:hypothetical protein